MSCQEATAVRLQIRLYAGQDDDLLRWLAQYDSMAHGAKSLAVKAALRRGIDAESDQIAAASGVSAVPTVDLAEVRLVVEAGVATALARWGGAAVVPTTNPEAEDEEMEDLMDQLEANLVFEEE